MSRILGAFAEFVFLLCVWVHVSTLVRMWEPPAGVVNVLYGIVVLLVIPMVVALNRLKVEHPDIFVPLDSWKIINEFLPWHTRFVCFAAWFYTVLLCVFLMFGPEGPIEKVGPDEYVMRSKGKVILRLNEEQAQRFMARQEAVYPVRGSSGLWMIVALFPAVVFRRVVPAMDARKTSRSK